LKLKQVIENIKIKTTMRLIINKTNQIGSLIMFSKLILILIITYHTFFWDYLITKAIYILLM